MGVVCAALIQLRRKDAVLGTHPAGFRLPAGPLWAVLGVLITVVLALQVDFTKSRDPGR